MDGEVPANQGRLRYTLCSIGANLGVRKLIHEGGPWKERLAKDADVIERWSAKTGVMERRSFLVEQIVFLAAYAMRSNCSPGWLECHADGLIGWAGVA